jgi:hypothetical protein
VALIANLLLTLWAGKKPTKRTFEMFCLFFMGWATEEELQKHLERLKDQTDDSSLQKASRPLLVPDTFSRSSAATSRRPDRTRRGAIDVSSEPALEC